jgi:hypothetical protein
LRDLVLTPHEQLQHLELDGGEVSADTASAQFGAGEVDFDITDCDDRVVVRRRPAKQTPEGAPEVREDLKGLVM